MSDDQVGCEWVSVSSGTGLPGLSQTKAIKRLYVCVCVCVYSLLSFKITKLVRFDTLCIKRNSRW